MNLTPIFYVTDMQKSLDFYINILKFEIRYPDTPEDPVIDITKEGADLQLSSMDGTKHAVVNIAVDEVDELFETFIKNGLDNTSKKDSPVHRSPLNQTWGMREFYVTDRDGHTLRFRRPI